MQASSTDNPKGQEALNAYLVWDFRGTRSEPVTAAVAGFYSAAWPEFGPPCTRVCHLYQSETLVRSLGTIGNNDVNYFVTTAGHSSLEPETASRLCTIMNELPPMSPFDRGGK